jgi:cupin-like protein
VNVIEELHGIDPRALPDEVLESSRPLVLRGVAADWPLVRAGRESPRAACEYLLRFYRQSTVGVFLGSPEIEGRFFYNDDLSGLNFKPALIKLDTVLEELLRHLETRRPPALYVGSTTIDSALPDFRRENDFEFGARDPLASIWIGNRSRIAAHHDLPDNIACVAVGRRRFTLFPPDQLANLYIGPLDLTPAGQPISLVDFHKPDFARFPKFAAALEQAQVAELEAGDAIFIPSFWWHHIESLAPLNVLVNYWWRRAPEHMDSPIQALLHAIMTVRDLPEDQRRMMEMMFRHYVFSPGEHTTGHIPENARRMLGPLDANRVREMRAYLLKFLNR